MTEQTLSGVRVVELATTIAGPYCAMVLADLGADVVKVERPDGGDDVRAMPPHADGLSTVFASVNRNKRSVALDLRESDAREAFLGLVEAADVVVQGFRPGAAVRLGLGHHDLVQRNPRLVHCDVSAFGDAAGGARAGYDPLLQAFTGMMSMTGEPGGQPVRVAASLIDLTTGMWAATGVLAALVRRDRTGEPQHVEATLVDSGFALLSHQVTTLLTTGEVPRPLGTASPITAPYEAFRTSDRWLMVAAGNQDLFRRLCTAVDLPALVDDPRFREVADRVRHRDALHEQLEARLRTAPATEWTALMDAAGVPAAPLNDLQEALDEPVVGERQVVARTAEGRVVGVRLPFDTRPAAYRPPPRLGQHTEEVLREWLPSGVGQP